MVKAVIFDYFGVLCSDEYWRFVREDKNLQGSFHTLSEAVNLGTMDWSAFINTVASRTGVPVEQVTELYQTAKLDPQVVNYLTKLHPTYKTALLTNGHYDFLEPRLRMTGLQKLFDVIVISSQVGMVKPAPEIFAYTLAKLGVKPEEAVLIDDIKRHVDGAKAVGMQAILYEDFALAKQQLDKLLQPV